jgi:hypothetical protein
MSDVESTTEVEYRPIEGFPGCWVGSDGSIWSSMRRGSKRTDYPWTRRTLSVDTNGYHFVCLSHGGVRVLRSVHRIVLEAFVGPCPEGMEARHGPDKTKTNNRVDNLRWGTHAENIEDMVIQGSRRSGVRAPSSALTLECIDRALELLATGRHTTREVADMVQVSEGVIGDMRAGATYKAETHGRLRRFQKVYRPTKGTQRANAKLTETKVTEARRRYASGEMSKDLAAEFGVSTTVMNLAINRKTWKHV